MSEQIIKDLVDCLKTVRDYVEDASKGGLVHQTVSGRILTLESMAKEDLSWIDRVLKAAEG